jgi:hypothetical protein
VSGFFAQLAAWDGAHATEDASAQVGNRNATEMATINRTPIYMYRTKQENTDCTPATNFLAA